MKYENINGVPDFIATEYDLKRFKYCLCIPVINEGNKLHRELEKASKTKIHKKVDIIICDGESTDGSLAVKYLQKYNVNSLLTKKGNGKQAAQLRMGMWWALQRGYKGIITIDGNDKDNIEAIQLFINKLDNGYDFVQGSRFINGGMSKNTPFIRYISIRLLHAPIISLTAGKWFTDTTNNYRAYSKRYLTDTRVQPFRNIFQTYELLAYLSVRASQLGMRTCEVPVIRAYPKRGTIPTKISPIKGNINLFKILLKNLFRKYNP